MKKVIIAILLILCLGIMAACSGKDDNTETAEYIYNEFELDKGNDSVDCAYLKGNDFYYVSYPDPDEDDDAAWEEWESKEYAGSLHQYKIDSGEDTVLFDVKDSNDILDLYVTEQNQIKILYNSYTESFRGYTIYTKTPDGADAGAVSLSDNINAALRRQCNIRRHIF